MKKNGLKAMLTQAAERLESHDYDDYTFESVSEEELEKQRKNAGSYSVRFSILVPAYNTPKEYFKEMIESVEAQTYPNWELIIGDAGDETKGLKEIAEEFSDRRVRYIKLPENKGISGNTNAILKKARGEYIALLDHDDFLTPDALYENAKLISEATKKPGLIYSDEDSFDANGVKLFDDKGRDCDFTVPEISDAILFLEKLNALNSGNSLYERNFAQGNVVFQPMLFSEYRAYKSQELSFKKYSGFEWECVTMPSGPSGDNYSRLDTLSIAMSDKTTQEYYAWEFMKLLTSDAQIQSEIFDYSAGISVLPKVTQSAETQNRLKESTGSVFNLDILESAMRKSVFRTRFRGYDNALEEVGLAVRSILDSNSNIQMEQIIWNRTINNYMKTLQQNE